MRRWIDAIRRIVGIREYRPGPIPRAKVRMPTGYGARGNGRHHAPVGDHYPSVHMVIARLAQQHRLIRQTIDDLARSWDRRGRHVE